MGAKVFSVLDLLGFVMVEGMLFDAFWIFGMW